MDTWNDPQGAGAGGPPGNKQDGPPEQRYLGLTAAQFNVAVFGIIGAIALAVGLVFFGGADAMQDLFGGDEEKPSESAVVVRTATPTATAVPSTPTPAQTPTTGTGDGTDEGGDIVEQVLNTFDPFTMMGALGSPGSVPDIDISGPGGTPAAPSEIADDSMKAILLQEGDLPPGFVSFGEMAYSIPIEGVTADMAISMFASGDLATADFGTIVMSAVIAGPGVTSVIGDFSEMKEITQADLDEAAAAMAEYGLTLTDLKVLDASGLGDAGMGMHMVMDLSSVADTFGVPEDDSIPDGIAWDMYVFLRGERVLMVMVMWPSDTAAGADALSLAEIMDARTAAQ